MENEKIGEDFGVESADEVKGGGPCEKISRGFYFSAFRLPWIFDKIVSLQKRLDYNDLACRVFMLAIHL